MNLFGQFLLVAGFAITLVGSVLGYAGGALRRPSWTVASRSALYGVALASLAAAFALVHALVTHDFSNQYVASYTDRSMPAAYILAAFWGGEKGALLFWVTVLSIFSSLAVYSKRHKDPVYLGYVTGTLHAALLFFFLLMVFASSPFETFVTHAGPADGRGMNPLLQNPTMTVHPPSLLTGYIAFTIPFAFGFGALLAGKLDDEWARDTRVWTLVSWLFLTLGLVLGGMWAYEELGWGGYWAWDPVENAGLIPWFTATAFLHSVMIQERRALLKRWNFFLVLLTFLLTIFGTFLTRSQLIASIHAFADSILGPYFLWYMLVIAIVSALALGWRWKALRPRQHIEHFLSREAFFVLNNVVLLGSAFIVLWGTVFAKVSELEAVQSAYNWLVAHYNATPLASLLGRAEPLTQAVVLGPPWFNRVMVPVGLVLMALTGIGPLISWRRATRKNFEKNFRFPLLLSLAATSLGALLLGAWRVAEAHRSLLAAARQHWMDAVRAWADATAGGTAPGPLPAPTSVSWAQAYHTWVDTLGRTDIYTFLAFFLCTFVAVTIFIEFYRGASVRRRKHGGSLLWNAVQLTLKARRRYGGYIVHLGVVFAFVAFAGNAFRKQAPEQPLQPGDKVDLAGYHVTLTGTHERWQPDGAYVEVAATAVVMRDRDAAPASLVQRYAQALEAAGLGPVHAEPVREQPIVRLHFDDEAHARAARLRLFAKTWVAPRFELRRGEDDRTLALVWHEREVLRLMPMTFMRSVKQLRAFFADMDDGTEVRSRPGSTRLALRFADAKARAAFERAVHGEPLLPGADGLRAGAAGAKTLDVFVSSVGTVLHPAVRFYEKHSNPTTEVAISSSILRDVYLAMRPAMGGPWVHLMVVVFPLVSFLWLGALVMLIGGAICLLPPVAVATLRVRARLAAPAASSATSLLVALGAATLLATGAARAQETKPQQAAPATQPPANVVHGPATSLPPLPADRLANEEAARQALFRAVACVARGEDGQLVQRGGTLASCPTPAAKALRTELASALRAARGSWADRVHAALAHFVGADPRREALLRYDAAAHHRFLEVTKCTCGCGTALSQCDMSCETAQRWRRVVALLMAEGYTIDEIQGLYLEAKNRSLEPGKPRWTLQDIRLDTHDSLTWLFPAALVVGAGSAVIGVLAWWRRRRGEPAREVVSVDVDGVTEADREELEDELDLLD